MVNAKRDYGSTFLDLPSRIYEGLLPSNLAEDKFPIFCARTSGNKDLRCGDTEVADIH